MVMPNQDQTLEQARKALGERIKSLRKQREWPQNTLAELAGMTIRKLSQIEKGETDIPLSTLHAIAQAFNISIAHLFHDVA